ncbi:hypothetical protein NKI34_19660 [Mesorhizobium sp. M0700]|uniref:hypothetical protein n=1 Tax=Mesorhizobium sp. M0700 TaxID=2956988 RepID=UPI003339724B
MKRHVGISLNLAQDESTVLPVDQIGRMTTHLAGPHCQGDACGLGRFLGEGGGDESRDDATDWAGG